MLLTIKELRNRMLNCRPDANVSIHFEDNEMVLLQWVWLKEDEVTDGVHSIVVPIERVRTDNRLFEREMHKAKRALKKGNRNE